MGYPCLTLHDGSPYYVETSLLIYSANQRTGFYMIGISVIKENLDVILFVETKIDFIFLSSQFAVINGYKTAKKDRNKHCNGILFYVTVDIPCKGSRTITLQP